MKKINFENVKKGEQLDKAKDISVKQFLQIWMSNSYPVKVDVNCRELYRDESFTYFGKNDFKLLHLAPHLYKIKNDSLKNNLGDYSKIDGQLIRQEFWEKIVPKSDIDQRKNSECMSSLSRHAFSYELQENKIIISLHWQIECKGTKILDKTYSGYYDLKKTKLIEG